MNWEISANMLVETPQFMWYHGVFLFIAFWVFLTLWFGMWATLGTAIGDLFVRRK